MCAAVPTIKASSDFQHIARNGKRWVTPGFIIQVLEKDKAGPFRLGLTASRKVGNAVARNRAKRRLREVVRTFEPPLVSSAGFDMVLIARTEGAERDFAQMKKDLAWGLRRLEILA